MRERRRRHAFAGIAIVAAAMAGIASYFAYSPPDALEHSIEHYAPAGSAGDTGRPQSDKPAGYTGPLPDYSVPGVEDKPLLSGGVAGLIGAGATFLVITGLGLALKRRRRTRREG